MFVHKEFRGQPHNTAYHLLSTAEDWARSHEVKRIFLGTTERFLAAHRFYEKHNYQEIEAQALPNNFPIMAVDKKFYMKPLGPSHPDIV